MVFSPPSDQTPLDLTVRKWFASISCCRYLRAEHNRGNIFVLLGTFSLVYATEDVCLIPMRFAEYGPSESIWKKFKLALKAYK